MSEKYTFKTYCHTKGNREFNLLEDENNRFLLRIHVYVTWMGKTWVSEEFFKKKTEYSCQYPEKKTGGSVEAGG